MTLLSPFISFEIPDGTTATLDKDTTLHKNDVKWLNIRYPRYRATIYCSYHILHKNLYNLSAESATPLQFVVTDSTRYLLRGALYFDESGKSDSIAPVIDYLSDDIIHLIESIETRAE